MKLNFKFCLTFLFLSSFLFLFFTEISSVSAKTPPPDPLTLDLQVPIPGGPSSITFKVEGDSEALGKYIRSIYNYAISIVGIVATVMLMFGGFVWLTAGGSGEKVGKARDIIFGALTGLVLALTSYTILTLINPDLVNFKIIKVDSPKGSKAPEQTETSTDQTMGCCKISTEKNGVFDKCSQVPKQLCDHFQMDGGLSTVHQLNSTCKLIPGNSIGVILGNKGAYTNKVNYTCE